MIIFCANVIINNFCQLITEKNSTLIILKAVLELLNLLNLRQVHSKNTLSID